MPFSLRYDLTRGDLGLVVDQSLDRESIASYTFDIIAHDGGNRTGAVRVHVTIHDVNDSPPKFDQAVYTVDNISETIPRDSVLLRIHATDDDTGINGEVSYHLVRDEPWLHRRRAHGRRARQVSVGLRDENEVSAGHRSER